MVKRAPGRQTGSRGRVTPKGTNAKGRQPKERVAPSSGRYTPPVPREQKISPRWVPALMFSFLVIGAAVILLNYLSLLPGAADNRYLLAGLALITGGFITATRYH